MKPEIEIREFRVGPRTRVRLDRWPTHIEPLYESRSGYEHALAAGTRRLSDLQQRLYADDRHALLLIFQAMDAAGKDGAIRHVMSGVNPQGCQVFSFKHPSAEELDHDFLWRAHRALPERGRIGIFNRSYYEEVLIVRVDPAILQAQRSAGIRTRRRGLLARALPLDRGVRAAPASQRHAYHQVLPAPVAGGAVPAVPCAHRQPRQELEVQRC